jgi:hypothetical protein
MVYLVHESMHELVWFGMSKQLDAETIKLILVR